VTGEGARRCEIRLILNEDGDPVGTEADDRPRQNGRKVPDSYLIGVAAHL
jgi:hypothetical protein